MVKTHFYVLLVVVMLSYALPSCAQNSTQRAKEIFYHEFYDFVRYQPDTSSAIPESEWKQVSEAISRRTESKDELRFSSKVSGSFTEPGVQEAAYLVQGGYHEPSWLVFSSDKGLEVRKVYAFDIARTSDLNRDRKQELLLVSGDTGQGVTTIHARLVHFSEDSLTTVKDFKEVGWDGCGTGRPDMSYQERSIIFREQHVKTPGPVFELNCTKDLATRGMVSKQVISLR